jgi:hypothetical protein
VLLAGVDPEYKFILIDLGGIGRRSDSSLFADSQVYFVIKFKLKTTIIKYR